MRALMPVRPGEAIAWRVYWMKLIEHWTPIGDELDLVTGRTGPSKLALALWLRFFTVEGRVPARRSELPDEAVGYVASQTKVAATDLGLFDWDGRFRPGPI